jgi:hypothetical protein
MNRIDIINYLIKKFKYNTYLEIGCQKNKVFDQIQVEHKIGVDPERGGTCRMTSNDFFISLAEGTIFDIVFIDGLHHKEQVLKDIENALKFLSESGSIVVHDCLPDSYEMQLVPRVTKAWTGNVWEAWVELRKTRKDLNMFVLDADHGCGIIQKGKQIPIKITEQISYQGFVNNKQKWVNLVKPEDFDKILEEGLKKKTTKKK